MGRIVCLGEALVDFVADEAGVSLAECPGFRKAAGGAPANVAAGIARLGGQAAFIGKVGEDPFGHFLADTVAAAGVDISGVQYDRDARTGLAFVSLMAEGERDFVFYRHPSADMRLTPAELDGNLIGGASVFHYGSISLIEEPSRAATLAAIEMARAGGARISYDPNLRLPLWPDANTARTTILETLPLADVVKVSDDEAEFLFDTPDPAAAAVEILALGAQLVVVTLGAAGCWLATRSHAVKVGGYPVEAVDTTGAGDAFVAALLLALADGEALGDLSPARLMELGCRGNAAGALTCTRKGAIPALPTRAELEAFQTARRSCATHIH